MYPKIRQEFFPNLSSKKCKVTLQLPTNIFCTSILLKNKDYEGGLSYIWVNMACDFNKFSITNIWFLVFLLIILQENTVVSVLHNFGRHGDQYYAVEYFNIFQTHMYHVAAHSNDPYVCSYTIWIWLLVCHIKHYTHYFTFSCQSDITSKFHILTMYALVTYIHTCHFISSIPLSH